MQINLHFFAIFLHFFTLLLAKIIPDPRQDHPRSSPYHPIPCGVQTPAAGPPCGRPDGRPNVAVASSSRHRHLPLTPTRCGRLRHPLAAAVRRAPLAGLPRIPFCRPSRSPTTPPHWRSRPCDGSPFWGCRFPPCGGGTPSAPLAMASLFRSGFAAGVNRPFGRRRVGVPTPRRVGVSAVSPCRPFDSAGRPVSSCGVAFPFRFFVAFSGLAWLRLSAGLFFGVFRPHYDSAKTQKDQASEPPAPKDPKRDAP